MNFEIKKDGSIPLYVPSNDKAVEQKPVTEFAAGIIAEADADKSTTLNDAELGDYFHGNDFLGYSAFYDMAFPDGSEEDKKAFYDKIYKTAGEQLTITADLVTKNKNPYDKDGLALNEFSALLYGTDGSLDGVKDGNLSPEELINMPNVDVVAAYTELFGIDPHVEAAKEAEEAKMEAEKVQTPSEDVPEPPSENFIQKVISFFKGIFS